MSEPSFEEIEEFLNKSWHPLAIQWRLGSRWNQWKFDLCSRLSILFRGRARYWRKRLARPAALLVDDDGTGRIDGNWLGAVRIGTASEVWPRGKDGRPMTPVLQMNIAESPTVPDQLRGVRLLTMYVRSSDDTYCTIYLPGWEGEVPEHGDDWCVRTYRDGEELVEIHPPPGTRLPQPMPMRWEFIDGDVPDTLTEVVKALYVTRIAWDDKWHRPGTRLGGWPTFIQGAWPWRPWSAEPGAPTYIFQVHSGHGVSWGDVGAASVGLTDDGRWVLTWDCY